MKLEFLMTNFSETIFKYQVPSKSVQWEPSFSIRTNGRTDMTKLIVAFRCFASLKVVCFLSVMSEHSEKKLWKATVCMECLGCKYGEFASLLVSSI
jgi:hypothetical protein